MTDTEKPLKGQPMTPQTTIFSAKKVITMFPEQPFARAVAVKDGRILGFGELDEMVHWVKNSPFTPYEIGDQFGIERRFTKFKDLSGILTSSFETGR